MAKNSNELLKDPEYLQLLECYQDAGFDHCMVLVEKLETRYPENQDLLQFKEELLMKLSFVRSVDSIAREERRTKRKKIVKMSIFAALATVVVTAVTLFVFYLVDLNSQSKQLEGDNLQLASLEYQADKLLDAGKPQPAAEIVERMKSINKNYENLPELMADTEELLELEQSYQYALDLVQQGNKEEALEVFKAIEIKRPNMWDVHYQVDLLETEFRIAALIEDGNRAFLVEDWDAVIDAYETVLVIDPTLDDPLMQEQLIQGYLNKIIGLLENENTTVQDIDNAENYYRNALSFVSQNREFAAERESLQQASGELLQLKFSQVAKEALTDKNQTTSSVAEAVSYLRKASNFDPENKALVDDLRYAEYYQMAFNNYLDRNWDQAITYLELLLSSNPSYADGNANILLYESYYAIGKQYASLGLYLDAINVLDKAEVIAWADSENLLKLFQVQVYLGEIYGKLSSYEDAVSYYQYALNAIDAGRKIPDNSEISDILSDANIQTAYRNFPDALDKYQTVVEGIEIVYQKSEVDIEDGACLAFFAAENLSTVDAIIEENSLPANMKVTFGRTISVPFIN